MCTIERFLSIHSHHHPRTSKHRIAILCLGLVALLRTSLEMQPTGLNLIWPTRDPDYLVIKVRKQLDKERVWVADEHESYGRQSFITRHTLQQCLPHDKIKALLGCPHDSVVNVVSQHYIRILGILIKIEALESIKHFLVHNFYQDSRLPILGAQSLPPASQDLFDKFFETQWQFCASEFRLGQLYRISLWPEQILPITKREVLKHGPDARVDKVTLHPEYNLLPQVNDLVPTFMLAIH